ncbi:MAG: NAD+ synthase [Phycisphaerae bacterium]
MKLGLLQIDPTVGDLDGNADRLIQAARTAGGQGCSLVVSPELVLLGYPPRDLLLNAGFVRRCRSVLDRVAAETASGPALLVGFAEPNESDVGRPLRNAAALLQDGRVVRTFHKTLLPTYDVFDEDRYFEPATGPQILEFAGRRFGISVCEDVWNDRDFWARRRYHHDPIEELVRAGATAIVNLSASPFSVGRQQLRERMLASMAKRHGVPILYTNQVGGNDDLLFDGRSCALDAGGRVFARGKAFEEDVIVVDLDAKTGTLAPDMLEPEAEVWHALVLGTRDYMRKCGFSSAVLGLSGGVDSSLVAAVAADAIGREHVLGVMMPSPYSSQGSIDDSVELARNLGMRTLTIPVADLMKGFEQALKPAFAERKPDVTEENIQARIRGNLLMAISNKFGSLLLTTGNKSEISVGYCTLYGDMSGGLAVIGDVPKTMVYRVCAWRNRRGPCVPESVMTKAPSAELRPDQKDQDSLPAYDVLDEILKRHVEQHQTPEEVIAAGFDEATVRKVARLVRIAEFKRKQAAPTLRVTDLAFGTGWRMPIARKG